MATPPPSILCTPTTNLLRLSPPNELPPDEFFPTLQPLPSQFSTVSCDDISAFMEGSDFSDITVKARVTLSSTPSPPWGSKVTKEEKESWMKSARERTQDPSQYTRATPENLQQLVCTSLN